MSSANYQAVEVGKPCPSHSIKLAKQDNVKRCNACVLLEDIVWQRTLYSRDCRQQLGRKLPEDSAHALFAHANVAKQEYASGEIDSV